MKKAMIMNWIKENWFLPVGALVSIGVIAYSFGVGKAKRKVRRRKRRTTSVASRPLSKAPSRITTKAGKVITGKANVQAYMKRVKALRKANKARRR